MRTDKRICGKDADTSAIQDAAVQVVKAVSMWCVAVRRVGISLDILNNANIWTVRATFSTLKNVISVNKVCLS